MSYLTRIPGSPYPTIEFTNLHEAENFWRTKLNDDECMVARNNLCTFYIRREQIEERDLYLKAICDQVTETIISISTLQCLSIGIAHKLGNETANYEADSNALEMYRAKLLNEYGFSCEWEFYHRTLNGNQKKNSTVSVV